MTELTTNSSLNERDTSSIINPRLQFLKVKKLFSNNSQSSTVQESGSMVLAVSQYSCKDHVSFIDLIHTDLSSNDPMTSYATEKKYKPHIIHQS